VEEDCEAAIPQRGRLTTAKEFVLSRKTLSSLAVFFVLLAIGLDTAAFGPALPLLSNQTHSTTDKTSFIFTGRSVGYLTGSLLSGPIYDKIHREGVFLGLSVVIGGVCHCAIPFCRSLYLVIALSALQGISFGALDTGGSVAIMRLHGDGVGSWMQAMHFFFAIGTTISPFIIGALIDATGGIRVSFLAFGVTTVVSGVLLLFVPPFTLANPPPPTTATATAAEKQPKSKVSRKMFWTIVLLSALFLMFYSTVESTFGGFLATYTIYRGAAGVVLASYLTSVFWGAFCLGRFLGIPAAMVLSPEAIGIISTIGCLCAMLPLVIFSPTWIIWMTACLYGLLMGPIWATVWNVLGKHVEITGKAAMFVVIGASIGDITVPVTIGALIVKIGPKILPFQQLGSDVALILFFVIILTVLRFAKQQRTRNRNFVELKESAVVEQPTLLDERPPSPPLTIVEMTTRT
jgi:FHS family Na+ dependent glucose MFS transporter 1